LPVPYNTQQLPRFPLDRLSSKGVLDSQAAGFALVGEFSYGSYHVDLARYGHQVGCGSHGGGCGAKGQLFSFGSMLVEFMAKQCVYVCALSGSRQGRFSFMGCRQEYGSLLLSRYVCLTKFCVLGVRILILLEREVLLACEVLPQSWERKKAGDQRDDS